MTLATDAFIRRFLIHVLPIQPRLNASATPSNGSRPLKRRA
jgi:hypothetical protein